MGPRPKKEAKKEEATIEPMVTTAGLAFARSAEARLKLQEMVAECLSPRTKDLMAKALAKVGGKDNPWPCGFDRASTITAMVGVSSSSALTDALANGVIKDEKSRGGAWQALRWALSIRASVNIEIPTLAEFEAGERRIAALQRRSLTDKNGKERHFVRIPWGPRVQGPDGKWGPSAISIAASEVVDALNACPAEPWRVASIGALLKDVEDACGFDSVVATASKDGRRVWSA